MKKSLSLTETKSMNAKLFFLILFLYQLLFTFQGLDLSDEGFFCTFYQEIFTHPETVQYNFMFWFSGIVGGAFVTVFGDLGVWGLRLFTAIITTGSIILVYNLLKNYLRAGNLQIGLLIATVVMNNNTKVFHYDNLSVFFYIVTAIWLVKGLRNNKPKYLFLAGIIVAMDAFTRIPSIVNTGLVLAIFYYGFSHKVPFKKQFGQAIIFGAGFVTGVAGMLLLMKMTGHLAIFLNAIALVGKMGSGGQESAYGFMKLIQQFINAYFASVKITALILAAVLAGAVALNFIAKKGYYRRWMGPVLGAIAIAGIIVLIRKGYIDNFTAIYFLTGLSLLAALLMLLDKTISKDLKLLMFIGCYILLSYPLGSGAGLYSVGIYSLWIAVPIAVDYLSSIQSLPRRFSNWIDGRQFVSIRKCTWIACIIVGVYYSWYYP
ncbi:MAG: glycosyltransferase family 39 protein, partial [Chitinophagaceae bacterium]